jgi:hypothetical protein
MQPAVAVLHIDAPAYVRVVPHGDARVAVEPAAAVDLGKLTSAGPPRCPWGTRKYT